MRLPPAKRETSGRGVDVVIEAAGSASAFRVTSEAVRPGGQIIWLGKIDVNKDVSFRWGSLMQEKRIRRVSYGNARPRRDFPLLARAYLDGSLMLDELITRRITLDEINDGFAALKRGETIRSVICSIDAAELLPPRKRRGKEHHHVSSVLRAKSSI